MAMRLNVTDKISSEYERKLNSLCASRGIASTTTLALMACGGDLMQF